MGEPTDANQLIADLERALPLQARDAVATALAAATMGGPEGVALVPVLRDMAAAELADLERIAARLATLGGAPAASVAEVRLPKGLRPALGRLAKGHRETLDALVEAIPADADDAEGEATEHLLEHVIARKRDHLELLERATR